MTPNAALTTLQRAHEQALIHPIRGNSYAASVRLVSHQIANLDNQEHLRTVLQAFETAIPALGLAGLSSVFVTALERASAADLDYWSVQRALCAWHSAGLPVVGDGGRDDLIVTRPGLLLICSHAAARREPLPTTGDDVIPWVTGLARAFIPGPGGR